MRRGMMKYLYIILEVIASLISESETHDDDAYKDDLSEEFCWDMTHYLLPDVWSDECNDEEYGDEW